MNELQVRLSADITALTSALSKAKKALKDFQDTGESGNQNEPLKEQVGLITALTSRLKALRTLQANAFDESDIIKYNQQLEETQTELTRLNALGRNVSQNLGGVGNGFQQVATKGANANGVAIEFNRIIQDAPFGIIGIGNNLQQLAGNFAQVSQSAGGTGAAIKASLASIISPVNLGLLAISALTAGFTAYQMGAFDFVTATDEAKTAQEEFNESLKDTEQTLKEGFFNELLKAQGLLKTENLGGRLVDVPAFETAQEVLEKLGSTINRLNKNELEALESFLSQRLADAARASANATTELEKSLANTDVTGYQEVLSKVNEQLSFYETDTKKSTKATKELKEEILSFSTDPLVDAYFKAIEAGAKFRASLASAASGLTGEEGEDPFKAIEEKIARDLASFNTTEFAQTAQDNLKKQIDLVGELSNAYAGLGALVGKAFNNPQFGTFIGQFAQFVTKIVAGAFAISKANAVAGATQSSLFTGPAAAFTLPGFIATAVGLVASAFSGIKGGGGSISGGGGGSVGIPSQTFGNANVVPNPVNPDLSGFGSGFALGGGRLTTEVSGDSLIFVLEQAQEKRSRS